MDATAATVSSPVLLRAMTSDAADVTLFAECFAKNSTARSHPALRWQYLDNPTGKVFADFAVAEDGRLAAIYATLPVRMRVDGKLVLGLQSVDTITDTAYRGRGLFLTLAKSTYERAASDGAALVYGFPNGSSAHGFFKRLSWTRLDPVPFLIRPLRSAYVLQRLKLGRLARRVPELRLYRRRRAKAAIVDIVRFDDRVDELWSNVANDVQVAVERDAAYLNWRLGEKPGEAYVNRGVFDGDRLAAFVSHTVKQKHGGNIGYVMEAMCLPGCQPALRALLHDALGTMVARGADVALAWCLPHMRSFPSYLRLGFVPFPTRMRPVELHFGARALTSDAAAAANRNAWYLSYTDSDTV